MGAWGTGNFENDAAADWLGDLVESNDFSQIEKTIRRVIGSTGFIAKLTGRAAPKYVDADMASNALAAAEIVAALRGNPADGLSKDALKFVSKFTGRESSELAALARKAIERISSDSELAELWKESGELEIWKNEITSVRSRLP